MAKIKSAFFCQSCGFQSPKWLGKCSSCGEWNTFVEEVQVTGKADPRQWNPEAKSGNSKPVFLKDINKLEVSRVVTADEELDRVLGGGIVPGSLILLGGEPGIGKSTLMLQIALSLGRNKQVLYVSGEESEHQILLRAERIGPTNSDGLKILNETNSGNIFQHLSQVQPDLLIIDSIQTLFTPHIDSTPGSVSQIRECTGELLRFAKETQTPIFLIGHITKDGSIAGPKVLEHMVDVVLQFEGDRNYHYRLLRSIKNRFGSTAELGIYEMQGSGLTGVQNPSDLLLNKHRENFSGIAIGTILEGNRPMLIETQTLVSTAVYGTPQRSCTGFDMRRLNMLLAVLEKRCGFRLAAKDVFLNLAGGFKVEDPALDLAVICATLSSNEDIALPGNICFTGEVGLSGEIRPVTRLEQRISEAQKLGFEKMAASSYSFSPKQTIEIEKKFQIEMIWVSKVEEVFRYLFG